MERVYTYNFGFNNSNSAVLLDNHISIGRGIWKSNFFLNFFEYLYPQPL